MRSVFNKSEYRRLMHRPVKIIQLLLNDIKCCMERITKGYCSKDVDNIDIWFLNIIPDMLHSLISEFREADEEKCSKHNVSEYQDEEEYLLKEKEIAKYRDECKNAAFTQFSKYFFDLWI